MAWRKRRLTAAAVLNNFSILLFAYERRGLAGRVGLLLATFLIFAGLTNCRQLPFRRYTVADGLPSDSVACVRRDSRGFLWFCTAEGLSRFDGYSFTNYGVDQGLPDRFVTDFIETRNGDFWVGTRKGIARFNPKPQTKAEIFTTYLPGNTEAAQLINTFIEDRGGRLWVATAGGLFELFKAEGRWGLRQADLGPCGGQGGVNSLAQDQAGNLWMAMGSYYGGSFLCRRRTDGEIEAFRDPFLTKNEITSVFVDSESRIWIGTFRGLALLVSQPDSTRRFIARVFRKEDGLRSNVVGAMFQSSDGKLWLGCEGVMAVIISDSKVRFEFLRGSEQGNGLVNAEDTSGNLWMGGTRLAIHGFVSYGSADGVQSNNFRSIFEGSDGKLYTVTSIHNRYIQRFDGKRFIAVAPLFPGHGADWDWSGWGWGQLHFQDHLGEWWIATGYGLLRYPKVRHLEDLARTPPKAIYTPRDGLGGIDIFRLYEDSRGDIWIAAWSGSSLTRWDRATGRFHAFGNAEGWQSNIPMAFREDRAGNLWIGSWAHDLTRYRRGRFEVFHPSDGFPDGSVLAIWLDRGGRVWAGTTRGGLVRIDQPDQDNLHFLAYTTRDGLSSNNIRTITEDHWGRIYAWTGVGLDRLEPETGAIVHFAPADGLPSAGSADLEAFCDRQGGLWFGFQDLYRLDPLPPATSVSELPIYINHVSTRGNGVPVSELGVTQVAGLVLRPSQDNLQIEFGSLNFQLGETLRYQYKLVGADQDWSAPSDLRRVNYAQLRPGRYQFLVRAMNSRGEVSGSPAQISFRLLAPVWQRWWFLSLAAALVAFISFRLYQYRVNSLLELERVRTRIASDLHDDIGSGLTQIAILSEVAKRSEGVGNHGDVLSRMADLSRELVDGMGEIVWAMNPQRDHLVDLVQRMRRFANDVLSAREIELEFHAPASDLDLPVRLDVRRNLYLIFKEAINNVVRHSGCTRVNITLTAEKSEMKLSVSDNGKGVHNPSDGDSCGGGRGLPSMRERARELRGTLEVTSKSGEGTRVSLRVPLSHRPLPGNTIPT